MGVQWDAGSERALTDSLVLAAILCNAAGRALSDEHFVFFNQLASPDLSVTDSATALGDDRDQIEIDLDAVPSEVERIVVVLYANAGPARRRTLGQLRRCLVRVVNADSSAELVRSEDFTSELTSETALAMGEVYRHRAEWKFKVIGQGYASGIAGIAADYGLSL
jgi:tellurium resistance protein TerD